MSILGWSWGTQTTGLYTMRHPEKVEKLILFAMAWKPRPGMGPVPLPKDQYRTTDEAGARSDFIAGQYEPDVVDLYVKEALAEVPKAPNGVRVDFATKLPILDPAAIRVPTLIIRPEKDFLSTEAETLEFFQKLGTNNKSYAFLPDGGHAILLEKNYRKFQNAALAFLDQP